MHLNWGRLQSIVKKSMHLNINSLKKISLFVVLYFRLNMQWMDTFAPILIWCATTQFWAPTFTSGVLTWKSQRKLAAYSIRERMRTGSTAVRFELVWTLTYIATPWLLHWLTLLTFTCIPLNFFLPCWPGTSGTQHQVQSIFLYVKWWLLDSFFETQKRH